MNERKWWVEVGLEFALCEFMSAAGESFGVTKGAGTV